MVFGNIGYQYAIELDSYFTPYIKSTQNELRILKSRTIKLLGKDRGKLWCDWIAQGFLSYDTKRTMNKTNKQKKQIN